MQRTHDLRKKKEGFFWSADRVANTNRKLIHPKWRSRVQTRVTTVNVQPNNVGFANCARSYDEKEPHRNLCRGYNGQFYLIPY